MGSSPSSASYAQPPSPTSVNSSPLHSDSRQKSSRVHFQAGDDVLLLREVVAVEHPFVRGSSCWEDIAATLQKDFPTKFAKVTARTLRERATNLLEASLSADARQRKQSGTEKEFREKEQLLESLREKFAERDMAKHAAAAGARKKEKEDKDKEEQLRQDALLTLKSKKSRQNDGPPGKKMKLDMEKIWKEKKEMKDAELKLRQRELELRERELALQEQKAKQTDAVQQQSMAQIGQMQTFMQEQMQQMTQLISFLARK